MPLPYGFMLAPYGHIAIDQEKANIVRTIYQQYLFGMSLKGIADFLFPKVSHHQGAKPNGHKL